MIPFKEPEAAPSGWYLACHESNCSFRERAETYSEALKLAEGHEHTVVISDAGFR